MKKILSLVLVFTFVFSLQVMLVSASEPEVLDVLHTHEEMLNSEEYNQLNGVRITYIQSNPKASLFSNRNQCCGIGTYFNYPLSIACYGEASNRICVKHVIQARQTCNYCGCIWDTIYYSEPGCGRRV